MLDIMAQIFKIPCFLYQRIYSLWKKKLIWGKSLRSKWYISLKPWLLQTWLIEKEQISDTHVITLNCTTPSGGSCDLTIGDGFNNTFLLVNSDIRTAVSPPVDYEALGDRNFVVTLEVHGTDPTDPSSNHTAVATVFVYVGPVNEFQPRFVGVPYTAQVKTTDRS